MAPESRSLRPVDRTAADITRQLREDFTRELYAVTGNMTAPDPVLAALFHAIADQVDRVYREADRVFFDAALDDLIRGLGLPPRLARPAQAVVQFRQIEDRELVSPETELIGYRTSGEHIVFTPDIPIEISPTELVFAAVYEAGRVLTLSGARLPWANLPIPPASAPLELPGSAPTLFLAFLTDAAHLSRLGLFTDLGPSAGPMSAVLARSPWQLLGRDGSVCEAGVLRATPARGGVRQLQFFRPTGETPEPSSGIARAMPLLSGIHGSQIWLFPEIPADRRFLSPPPPVLAEALPHLLPQGQERALDRPLAWVQIPLPAGTRGVAGAVPRVAVNCMTASNIEIFNESINFDRMGSVVSHRPMGSTTRHVMGVLSVTGESGTVYVNSANLEAPATAGRYRYRGGARFEFSPAQHPSGRFDSYAMLRSLLCDGDDANGIEPGGIRQVRSELPRNPMVRVTSLTPSKGGAPPPPYDVARNHFAELLRTRERVVTSSDIEISALTYEPRLRRVEIEPASEITAAGLGVVIRVTGYAAPDDFADPEADFERLQAELQQHLEERSMIGHRITVSVRPMQPKA